MYKCSTSLGLIFNYWFKTRIMGFIKILEITTVLAEIED